jgi:hypothetical protein
MRSLPTLEPGTILLTPCSLNSTISALRTHSAKSETLLHGDGDERVAGTPHVIWRRIGTRAIFTPPPGP